MVKKWEMMKTKKFQKYLPLFKQAKERGYRFNFESWLIQMGLK